MSINELINSTGDDMSGDMDNMDGSLNYDNPDLMSSDFFDSVLSLENNLDHSYFPELVDDFHLTSDTSCHTDDVLSPRSLYSESERSCSNNSEIVEEPAALFNGLEGLDNTDVPMLMSFLEPVPDVEEREREINVVQTPTPTKIYIQNPNNKKIIAKPIIHTGQIKKNVKTKPQILKVQSLSSNGRPVLLPLSVKSIKILNSSADLTTLTNGLKRRKIEAEDDTNIVSSTETQYKPLSLTNEEKRLLAKEGIRLPTHHPLTKNEERELKRIRRKIRNKISAQDSRKRKKEYVDGLEERVKRGSEENKNLLQRVRELQKQNKNLMAHVSRLQALICKSTTTKATPSTCLMVVLLSALLVSLPNIRLQEKQQLSNEQEQVGVRRSLLSSQQATEDDNLNMEEFLVFKEDDLPADFGEEALFDIENTTSDKELAKMLEEVKKKYNNDKNNSDSIFSKLMNTLKHFLDRDKENYGEYGGGYHNKIGFIEPDIDDDPGDVLPMAKRMRFVEVDEINNNNGEKIVSATVNSFAITSSKEK